MNKCRVSRYLVQLLWHWTLPFMFGAITASVVLTLQLVGFSLEFERVFEQALIGYCGAKQ